MVDLTAATLVAAVGTAGRETTHREAIAVDNRQAGFDTIPVADKAVGFIRPNLGVRAATPTSPVD
ncbi:MAG: hypothetical protein AAGB11_11000 [Pseudomonadota bacterium]